MIVVDTSVWIEASRQPRSDTARELDSLLATEQVMMVGPVFTEVLQGSRSDREYYFYQSHLTALPYIEVDLETWRQVAILTIALKKPGKQIGFPDRIIAALSIQHDLPLYALDPDFDRVPNLKRYRPAHD